MDFPENVLSLLPSPSRAKLEALLIEQKAARAVYVDASDTERQLWQEAGLAEARAREKLNAAPGISQHPGAAVAEARKLARKLATEAGRAEREAHEARILEPAKAARHRHRLAVTAKDRAAARQDEFALLETIESWLTRSARLGGGSFTHFAPKLPRIKDASAEVAKLRDELEKLEEAWQQVEAAPVPPEILHRQALAEIDAIADAAALKIAPTDRTGTPLHLARAIQIGQMPIRQAGADQPHMALVGKAGAPLFVHLLRDQLYAQVERLVTELPEEGALDDVQREARFAEIAEQRLELERQEEAVIVAAEAAGYRIPRRREADPRAVLEIVEN